jgi:CheY-like chemotaxis protein
VVESTDKDNQYFPRIAALRGCFHPSGDTRMAKVMVLTHDADLFEAIRDGFASTMPAQDVELLRKSEEGVARVCDPNLAKAHIAFVDISTISDGERFIDFVKSSPSTRYLQVVVITDNPQPPSRKEAQTATHVLSKPISPKEITKIAETLRLQQAS